MSGSADALKKTRSWKRAITFSWARWHECISYENYYRSAPTMLTAHNLMLMKVKWCIVYVYLWLNKVYRRQYESAKLSLMANAPPHQSSLRISCAAVHKEICKQAQKQKLIRFSKAKRKIILSRRRCSAAIPS